ncbi:hypothetical protein [Mucilaginibacter sp. 22184]|uniref:hypothetical protein n=1 Tax=Mucilaginibacter sp. 22184 TaxID=3453887 RepID=UPI003F83348D
MKNALLKVGGFDYVPENLRSVTFIKAAKQVVETHFASNNFYNKPGVVKRLASLGTVIPPAALMPCFQAYLIVLIGNNYGRSWDAVSIAEAELRKISIDRWIHFFKVGINKDEIILNELSGAKVRYLTEFLNQNGLNTFDDLPRKNKQLYNALLEGNRLRIEKFASDLLA